MLKEVSSAFYQRKVIIETVCTVNTGTVGLPYVVVQRLG